MNKNTFDTGWHTACKNFITTKSETRTINQIKKKLTDNGAMITKADKGNSIVILYIVD
jgi:hypothetical protein